MKKVLCVLMILVMNFITFSQITKEESKIDKPMLSISNVQYLNEEVIIFDSELIKEGKTSLITVVADCKTKVSILVVIAQNGEVFRVNRKFDVPPKDSLFEVAVLSACNKKK